MFASVPDILHTNTNMEEQEYWLYPPHFIEDFYSVYESENKPVDAWTNESNLWTGTTLTRQSNCELFWKVTKVSIEHAQDTDIKSFKRVQSFIKDKIC